jgi:zinc finger SWIM domain-containing protein 3
LKILDINNVKKIPKQYILKRWTIDAKVLHIKRNSETQEDPKTKLSQRRKESDETFFMAVSSAEQLAEDVEKSLGKRFDPDLDSLTHT